MTSIEKLYAIQSIIGIFTQLKDILKPVGGIQSTQRVDDKKIKKIKRY